MSFRSRSTTKPVAPPRRRSSSLTRSAGTSNGYQSTSTNGRPYSIHGSTLSSFPSQSSSFLYGSNQNLRSDYTSPYSNGTDYRRSSYGTSNGSLKFPMTTMNTSSGSSYTSPYKDRYSQGYYNGSNGTSGYTSAYKDRSIHNPYTSYDNGVTTASLSINYTPTRGLGGSSQNLSGQSINEQIANIGRSQSLREHERKNRSRKYKEAAKAAVPDTSVPYEASGMSSSLSSAQKSLSSLSLQSEGYEVKFALLICLELSPWIWT